MGRKLNYDIVTSIKEHVTHALDDLNEAALRQVADYVAFLKFRARLAPLPVEDEAYLAALYAEETASAHMAETALLSEAALAEDWDRPEEDAAWAHLQPQQ